MKRSSKTDADPQPLSHLPFPSNADKLAKRSSSLFVYTTAIGLVGAIAWSSFAEVDIVTRGAGTVVPSLQNQFVQHFEGGIIGEILVFEGQSVSANDVLMRIENPFSEAEYSKANLELSSKLAELIRLEAESKVTSEIDFPEAMQKSFPNIVRNETRLFNLRKQNLQEKVLILKDQHSQKTLEKKEKLKRLENMRIEYGLANKQVKSLTKLKRAGAVSENEWLRVKTSLQQIQTKISDLEFQVPQVDVELSEIIRRQQELNLGFRSEAEAEKNKVKQKVEQLKDTLFALNDRKVRTELRAPISGKIHRIFQSTVGGVVRSGQNLVQIIPSDSPISIEVKLSPKDRAKVWKDLPAVAKLSAYDFSSFGGIDARVIDISTDTHQDGEGEPYFRVKLEANMKDADEDMTIVAGMSAEVDIITGKRTIMQYLLKPISEVYNKALRES